MLIGPCWQARFQPSLCISVFMFMVYVCEIFGTFTGVSWKPIPLSLSPFYHINKGKMCKIYKLYILNLEEKKEGF